MKTQMKIWIIVIVTLFMLPACKKEAGIDGKKEIHGKVTYTGGAAIGAIVYITYGATESTGSYDNSTVADASGLYEFKNLALGDYFIDAEYTDENDFTFNTAGYTVTVGSKKGEVDVDIVLE